MGLLDGRRVLLLLLVVVVEFALATLYISYGHGLSSIRV